MKILARAIFTRYKGLVRYWLTFNEINNLIDTDNPFNAWTGAGVLYEDNENIEQTNVSNISLSVCLQVLEQFKEQKKLMPLCK